MLNNNLIISLNISKIKNVNNIKIYKKILNKKYKIINNSISYIIFKKKL
jgi:hypothetical protein